MSYNSSTSGTRLAEHFASHIANKTIVITGTSAGGLGAATAIALAHGKPAAIFLLARSQSKVTPVMDQIKKISPQTKTQFVPIDLADWDSVRAAASQIRQATDKVDILINNAGIMALKDYSTNKQGVETQLATNHLGHFVLTRDLLPLLLQSARQHGATRIVNLTSDGYTISPFHPDDPSFGTGTTYDPWAGYGQSKTANVLFTRGLAARFARRSVPIQTFAVHPGVVTSTALSNHLTQGDFAEIDATAVKYTGEPFAMGAFKGEDQGIAGTVRAALDPGLAGETGAYMEDCKVKAIREYARNEGTVERLWEMSEEWTGLKFEI